MRRSLRSSVAVPLAAGTVYVGSGDGAVYAVDPRAGTVRWRTPLGGAVASAPAVANGLVFVLAHGGALRALRAADGRLVWSLATGAPAPLAWGYGSGELYESSPALADGGATLVVGVVYVGARDGCLYAIDAARVAPVAADTVLFRRLLDAGNTVVWPGTPPLIARPGMRGLAELDRDAPRRLTGVAFARGHFDAVGVTRRTPEGVQTAAELRPR